LKQVSEPTGYAVMASVTGVVEGAPTAIGALERPGLSPRSFIVVAKEWENLLYFTLPSNGEVFGEVTRSYGDERKSWE
jgi:hypothetical protein